ACLMFECLTGSLPHGQRSEVAALFAHLEEPTPKASERGGGLPAAIDPVLERGMAKDPGDRFESCAALVEEAGESLRLSAPPPPRRAAARAVCPPGSPPLWRSPPPSSSLPSPPAAAVPTPPLLRVRWSGSIRKPTGSPRIWRSTVTRARSSPPRAGSGRPT